MANLALLQPDARVASRLLAVLSKQHAVRLVPSWQGLQAALDDGLVDGVVIDTDHPDRERATSRIALLRKRHPHLAIVACTESLHQEGEIYRLGGLGVDGVLSSSLLQESGTVRKTVQQAVAAARASFVRSVLERSHGPTAARAVAWAMENAKSRPTPRRMVEDLGLTPRALATSLREAHLPAAGRLLVWGRLLLAASYLDRDGHTLEATAFMVGYTSPNSLGRAMKRETGSPPREVARRGGLSLVLEALFSLPVPPTPHHRTKPGRSAVPRILLAAFLLPWLQACATTRGGRGPVDAEAVDRVLDTPPLDRVTFGVLAVDAASGKVLYERNADRTMIPASNEKVLVTSAALSLLGDDYTYETALWSTGPLRSGTLDGDLVLPAAGDPTLSERYWDSGRDAMDALADSLHAGGVRRVTGSLVVDASAWDSTTVGPTWEVEDLRFRYGSTGGAFALEQGELHVVVTGGSSPGEPVGLDWHPRGSPVFVTSELTTAPVDSSTRVTPSYLPESRRVVLRGHVAQGVTDTLLFAQRDPVREATRVLANALRDAGIEVAAGSSVAWVPGRLLAGECRTGSVPDCPAARRLAGLTSPPLARIVAGILKPSQNWMAEQLLRTLGAEFGKRGGWPAGIAVLRRFLQDEVGLDSLAARPRDGSGLSAYNLVSPRAMVATLRFMAGGPYAAAYREALAAAGERDSTLEHRLDGLQGQVFAKTGTISNVNALSGYLVRDDGRDVVFSILSNGSGLRSSRVRSAIDDVVRVLAR